MSDETPMGPVGETHSDGDGGSPPERRASRRPQPRGGRPSGRPQGRRGVPQTVRAKKRRVGCLAAIVFLLVVALGASGLVWWTLYRPALDTVAGQPVQIEVPKGASTAEIGELLANTGVVANPFMFRLQQRSSADTRPLKAGVYDLATGMTYEAALTALREGPVIQYVSFTVPEGWTLEQISKRVEEKTGVPAADVLALASTGAAQFDYPFLADNTTGSLQGYLFPKTYRVKVGSTAKEIVGVMLQQFGKETAGLDMSYAASRGLNMHGVVTVASIIEREARVDKDRPLISSVIYNRLGRDMKLEICATVQFVVGNKPRLLYSDLKVQSPYNTYIHKGLPPGPIASPGIASLQAAVAPAQTQYLYYVLTHRDGSHSFSKTSAEHLRYKAQAEKGLK
jgi:UPF0755 protein